MVKLIAMLDQFLAQPRPLAPPLTCLNYAHCDSSRQAGKVIIIMIIPGTS
jgi:hypothetical protein